LAGLRFSWLTLATVLTILTYYGRALRWAVMVRALGREPELGRLFSATAMGFTAIVLFGRAGEFVRPYLISVKEKVSFSSQLAAWFIERVCDMLAALLIFGYALALVGHSAAKVGPALQLTLRTGGYVVTIVGLACLFIMAAFSRSSDWSSRRIDALLTVLPDKWRGRISEFMSSFIIGAGCTRSAKALFELAGYTLLEWALLAFVYVASLKAFPSLSHLGVTDALILLGFVAFGSMVQLPGIGGGVQVATILVMTEIFRTPLEVASGLALINYVLGFVVVALIGIPLMLHEGFNWRKLREMEKETVL
jgi:hypothetical protein